MPPSPRLSARSTNQTYLNETMKLMDQKISEVNAEDVVGRTAENAVMSGEALLDRIQRAGSDVPVHHAESRKGQAGHRLPRAAMPWYLTTLRRPRGP